MGAAAPLSRPPEAAPHEHRTQWTVAARSEHEEPKCARLLGEHHGGLPLDHDAVDGDIGETLDYSYEKQLKLMANVKNGIAEVATSAQAAAEPAGQPARAGREARRAGAPSAGHGQ